MKEKLTYTRPPDHLPDEQKLAWKVLAGLGIKAPSEFIPRYPAARILAALYTMRLRGKSIGWLIGALKGEWEVQVPHPGWDPFDPRKPDPEGAADKRRSALSIAETQALLKEYRRRGEPTADAAAEAEAMKLRLWEAMSNEEKDEALRLAAERGNVLD